MSYITLSVNPAAIHTQRGILKGNAYKTQAASKRRSVRELFLCHPHEVVALADLLRGNRSKIKGGKAKATRCVHVGLGRYTLYEEHGETARRAESEGNMNNQAGPNHTEHAEHHGRWLKATRDWRSRFQPHRGKV